MKNVKSFFSLVIAAVMLLSMLPVFSLTASAAKGTDYTSNSTIASRIDQALSSYAPGSYYTKNGKACSSCHTNNSFSCVDNPSACNCLRKPTINGNKVDLGAVQCLGYARYWQEVLFGYNEYSDSNKFTKLGAISGSMTATKVKEWFVSNKDMLHPGTHIRLEGSSFNHSIVVLGVDYDAGTFTYIQCNWSNQSTNGCLVSSILTVTWSKFVSNFSSYKLVYANVYKNYRSEYPDNALSNNTLTINYNINGGSILSEILLYNYEVTEEAGINMRETAGTSGEKLTALPEGTSFTVNYGDTKQADGYTWGKTTYNGYTGWVVISDFVALLSTVRSTDFYAESSIVYRSSSSSILNDVNEYGVYNSTGLYNNESFDLYREGYDFVGWSFTPTGEEIIDENMGFKPEEIVPELENGSLTVTVYAIWKRTAKINVTFSYDANGGTGSMADANGVEGQSVTLSANTYVNDGYDFVGWQIQRTDGKWYIEEYGWYPIDLIDEKGYIITTYQDSAEICLDGDFVTLDSDFTCTLYAVWEAKLEPEPEFEIKSVSYEIVNDKVIFTVVTTPDFNRVKVTNVDNLSSYIAYSSNYVVNADGDYVFTLSVPAVAGTTQYAFDGRKTDTNKYAKAYACMEVDVEEIIPTIMSVTHTISNGKIIFTVITKAGNFSRIKVTTANALSGSLGVASSYTVNADGNYVWTIKAAEPSENTNYAFDLRNGETGKYHKEYCYYEAEAATPAIVGVSHIVSDGKIIFTVITKAANYSRIKVTTSNSLSGSLGVASSYTVNADGNYVWTIKAVEPSENTTYAFDLRNGETGKYIKEYFYYDVEAATPSILDVSHTVSGDKVIFSVTTKAGNYDRIKATLADNLGGSVAVATSYMVDADGNYVWTVKAPIYDAPYAFDLRVAGGRYQKDYFIYNI